ncbi:hypothetical protein [Neogemmobacter tilapiae]|uniref:PepSY domain-containing protein n=1 Tax=Neogemmobacter tilapiae TaxID=875041 RepID=A0A918TLZ6_9RHOB|nr:hypothetical protein [Gemmobacter tilapiae]GHC54081.1 hypothetical protein GCM10007315_16110 [Gemmobacter tilapiae]
MKKVLATAAAAALVLQMWSGAALADKKSDEFALAAAAILGIAAVSHKETHYRDGYRPKDAAETADFERGYRDGLHNVAFDPANSSTAFAQGYDAGQKERANSLSYKTSNVKGVKVPQAAMNSCVNDAASAMSVGRHQIHVVKAGQEGADNYYIELASGHKHLVCSVNAKGEIFDTRYGRL